MNPLLCVKNLSVHFPSKEGTLHAVRNISFDVMEGQSLGIVGESGSGKTAAMQAIAKLSTANVSGHFAFAGGKPIACGKDIGMIFQDPMTHLNPTMKIGAQITEGLIYHKMATRSQAKQRALELLDLVKIPDPKSRINHYPHQLSGGMRQRVLIAIALACQPKLLIADEPTTALDEEVQEQILDLILQMKQQFQMSLILISHNFRVIAKMCEKVLVMYAGKIIEQGDLNQVLKEPRHPYTKMLLNTIPTIDQSKDTPLQVIEGMPPNLLKPPIGCAFKERCPMAALQCNIEPTGDVACWRCHD